VKYDQQIAKALRRLKPDADAGAVEKATGDILTHMGLLKAVPPFRHQLQQFASAALGADSNFCGLRDERGVFGLLCVGLHRDGLVADAFDFSIGPREGIARSGTSGEKSGIW
jgi:hypothetical protein